MNDETTDRFCHSLVLCAVDAIFEWGEEINKPRQHFDLSLCMDTTGETGAGFGRD